MAKNGPKSKTLYLSFWQFCFKHPNKNDCQLI